MKLAAGMVLALAVTMAAAEVKLASPFSSNMVLQRQTEVTIWGTADPGEQITLRATWGATGKATADDKGQWRAKLKTGPAGGPHELSVSGSNSLYLRNILLGEVWVCSGQSNMEWPLNIVENGPAEVAAANHPNLRFLTVPHRMADQPENSFAGSWVACKPETARGFSATAYYFGLALQRELRVPVGLIQTAVGGTEAELWTSEPTLRTMPDLAARFDAVRQRYQEAQNAAAERRKRLAADPGLGQWSANEMDDREWSRISDPGLWREGDLADLDGTVWYRARLLLTDSQAKEGGTLRLGQIDDEDEVWINGRPVGKTAGAGQERAYQVKPEGLREGFNTVAIRVTDTGGEAGFRNPRAIGFFPKEGSIPLTNWRYRIGVKTNDLPAPFGAPRPGASLYNGMIAPLVPYTIRGAIWYQGESNVSRAEQYRTLFPAMIADWRKAWGMELAFYFVQISPFEYGQNHASAELREAQLDTYRTVPMTGIAVTADIVPNLRDIHPTIKQPVGERLAKWALVNQYGRKDIVPSGPLYKSAKRDGKAMRVEFDFGVGLTVKGDSILGLEIAGEDLKFVPAQGKVEGSTLVVWADGVEKPAAVRLGWKDAVLMNLFNGAGLPASPFRTDSAPRLTAGVKW
ncbi:MAG: hypothetical protein IT363_06215 [Methanoregulaceae archaeon]|nr:hypothetical protein [Methanoregulaceae archaeon]